MMVKGKVDTHKAKLRSHQHKGKYFDYLVEGIQQTEVTKRSELYAE